MSTSLPSPDQMNPSSQKNKNQEMERLQQEFDSRTGRATSNPQPWHTEKGLSKATRDLLDAQEPQQKRSGGFYHEPEAVRMQQDAFDAAIKNIPAQGAGTYKLGPVTLEERLRSWHRALGTPIHIVEQEVAQLKQQQEAGK